METVEKLPLTDFSKGKLVYTLLQGEEDWEAYGTDIYVRKQNDIFLNGNQKIAAIRYDEGTYPRWAPHRSGVVVHEGHSFYLENQLEKRRFKLYEGVYSSWVPAGNGIYVICRTNNMCDPASIVWHVTEDGQHRIVASSRSWLDIYPQESGFIFSSDSKFYQGPGYMNKIYEVPLGKGNDIQHFYAHKEGLVYEDWSTYYIVNEKTGIYRVLFKGSAICRVTLEGIFVQKRNEKEIRFFTGNE